MVRFLVGAVSLVFMVWILVSTVSADDDFSFGTVLDAPMSYSIPYVESPGDTLTYNPDTDVCQYWSVSPLGDWYYGFIIDPLVTYVLTFWAGETVVVGCTSR